MRIALINPNISAATTAAMVEIAQEAAAGRAEIYGRTAPFGAPLITDGPSLDIAADAVNSLAPTLTGTDAVIVAAFGDPGRETLAERLSVPVTGIAEAGMAEAAVDGRRFAVVTTTPKLRQRICETAARHNHSNFAGTWTTDGDPEDLMADLDGLQAALAGAIWMAVEEAGVEAVIIGGGPLAVAARSLSSQSPVPLIEPLPAAVRLTLARALDRRPR
ncbi:MAG: aspartate/glutamate racemase family protein [Alphaproteobacteria bacterium]|nr:aspartate/glutamate racemase family protein [Alphaproteobacteria bacterium]